MSEQSLDDVLNGETGETEDVAETTETETVTPTDTEEATETETTEVTDEVEKDEKRPPTADEFKGMLDEREKRQDLQRQLEERDKQIAQFKAQQTPETPIDPIDDPEGFRAQTDQKMHAMELKFQRELMQVKYDDWGKAEEWVNGQIGTNAALAARLQGSDSIFEDAYKMYQDHLKLEEMSDIDTLRERIREEERAKILAETSEQTDEAKTKEAETNKAIDKISTVTTGTTQSIGHTGELTLEDVMGGDALNRPK